MTGPLKEDILNGRVHTIDEMKAWLQPLGYSDAINEAAIKFILCEFVKREVSTDSMMNMDMVVESIRPQMEVTKEDIEPSLSWDYTIIVTLLGQQMRFGFGH